MWHNICHLNQFKSLTYTLWKKMLLVKYLKFLSKNLIIFLTCYSSSWWWKRKIATKHTESNLCYQGQQVF